MTAVIFAGPSVYGLDVPSRPDLIVRPPAMQGDIFRACLTKPDAIGLIDGYFEGVPSVWHKEILWALSQGIAVLGSASMGALRAAELDVFGMTGVGQIYQWYRDGVLEDDDEVALTHGPRETGYLPLSEAMVNVRATCNAAVEAGILLRSAADAMVSTAKNIHYRDRTWIRVFEAAKAHKSVAVELENALERNRLCGPEAARRGCIDHGHTKGRRRIKAREFNRISLRVDGCMGQGRARLDQRSVAGRRSCHHAKCRHRRIASRSRAV
jgi:hypothetical protein